MTKRVIRQIDVTNGGAALQVLDGRYGPYVSDGQTNASIPKGTDPATLSLDDALALLEARRGAPPREKRGGRFGAKRRPTRAAAPRVTAPVDAGPLVKLRAPVPRVKAKAKAKVKARRKSAPARAPTDGDPDRGRRLAGSEAAWQAASQGVKVTLYEMRPVRPTAVHKTDRLAELVCSNSFRGTSSITPSAC